MTNVVSGFAAQCRGPAFFCLWEGRRWTGRRWVAGSTREELAGRATRKERHPKAREKKGERCFSFSRGKDWRAFACLSGGSRGRGAAIAALGIGTAAKTMRAQLRHRAEHGMEDPACCGLWPPFQLIQLIDLRYLCVGTERKKWMDVCFLLTLYI